MSDPPQGSPGESRAEVTVLLEDGGDVPAVLERLRAAGLSVGETLEASGVVTGSAPASATDALRAVDGVAKVEVARDFQLPPSDSPIQ